MKVNRIIIGPEDAPVLEFLNKDILEITENTSVSMVGAELAIDQFVPIVKYDLIIRYVLVPKDLEFFQSFLTADGYTLTGKYTYDIRATPYGTPVRFYIDSRPAGLYYLSKVDRLERDTFKLSCVSAVGLMDKQRHIGDIHGIADPSGRLLIGIGAFIDRIGGVDPAGGDRVNSDFSRKAHCHSVGQRRNAALGCGIAFALRLTHPVPGGRDVEDAGTGSKIRCKQLA